MKRYLLASTICIAPFAATAADMPVRAPVYKMPPAMLFTWTGLYAGASAGIISQGTTVDFMNPGGSLINSFGITGIGFIGGSDIGYNWQFANWVLGLEGDISGTSLDDSSTFCCTVTYSSRLDALATVRGRFGYAFDHALLYATGGWAYGHVRNEVNAGSSPFSVSTDDWRSGWTAGGGLEYAFMPNWTVRCEALYVDLGTTDMVNTSGCRFGFKNHYTIGRVGLNYKF